jgi:tripartite-type tricarboxylate transporter receptor subunit TctC
MDTPTELIATLNCEINAALADPKMKMRRTGLGCAPMSMSPRQLWRTQRPGGW